MSNEIFNSICPEAQFDSPFDEKALWKTIISPTEGGREYRYQKWRYPKRSWNIIADARNESEINAIWEFYMRMNGAAESFLFENPNDNPVTSDVFATGDGVNTVFYLGNKFRLPTGDAYIASGTLDITKSVGGTGSYLPYSSYSMDYTIGRVLASPAVPSGDVLKADYRFYYRARFQEDELSRRQFATALWSSELKLIQVI